MASSLSRRARTGLAVLLFAALAAPLVYVSRTPKVHADDAKPSPTVRYASPNAPTTSTYLNVLAAEVGPAAEFLPIPSENEKKIMAELDKPTTIDFQETPLQGVVDYLKDLHGIEIQIDDRALSEAGIEPEVQVTMSLKGISLRSTLNLLLSNLDMTYLIKNEVLLLTTTDKASRELTTRTYPVSDLLEKDEHGEFVKAITDTVKPLTWKQGGGEGRIAPDPGSKSLVISQTQDVHDEILHLLRSLREARKTAAAAAGSK